MGQKENKIVDQKNKPTAKGLAFLIWISLDALKRKKCSESDCKEAINNLIRAYGHHKTLTWGESFFHSLKFYDQSSKFKKGGVKDKNYLEHVIPIKVIMDILIEHMYSGEITGPSNVVAYLKELLIICRITEKEEKNLRDHKLTSTMCVNEEMSYAKIKENKFIRYKTCDISHISENNDHWCDVPLRRVKINRPTDTC